MDDGYIYTVGMHGVKVKIHSILRAFSIKRGKRQCIFQKLLLNAKILKCFTVGSMKKLCSVEGEFFSVNSIISIQFIIFKIIEMPILPYNAVNT